MKYLTHAKNFFISLLSPYPARDWYGAVVVTIVVTLVLIGLSVYLFFGIRSGFIIVPAETAQTQAPSVSREALQDTVETYSQRATNFEAESYPTPDVSDPSF